MMTTEGISSSFQFHAVRENDDDNDEDDKEKVVPTVATDDVQTKEQDANQAPAQAVVGRPIPSVKNSLYNPTPPVKFHAVSVNNDDIDEDDKAKVVPTVTSDDVKTKEQNANQAPAPAVVGRPIPSVKNSLYNPTPPASPKVSRSNVRTRNVKNIVPKDPASPTAKVKLEKDPVKSQKTVTSSENPPVLCLKPQTINVLKNKTTTQQHDGACAVGSDPASGDPVDDYPDCQTHMSRGEYSDDFEDSDAEDLGVDGDFDLDEQLYAELAFGIDIEPGDLDFQLGGIGSGSGGEQTIGDLSLEIIGSKMPVAEAWTEEAPALQNETDSLQPPKTKDKTHKYLIEQKMGPNVFMMKDLGAEKKHQFKVLRRVPVREDDPDSVVSSMRAFQSQLAHDHLVAVDDVALEEGSVSITQPYCEGGTLHSLILRARSYGEILNEIEVLDWFVQCLLALKHLHSKNITHQEVTTSNLYLKNNCIRLGAPVCFKSLYRKVKDIPNKKLHYMSPEVVQGGEITQKSDMWSLGCVLYELCALKRLFRGKGRDQITADINSSIASDKLPAFPSAYNSDLGDTWRRLVAYEPDQRPTACDVLQLPFIALHLEDMTESLQQWKGDDNFGETIHHTPPGGWSDLDVDEDCFLTEEDAKELFGF